MKVTCHFSRPTTTINAFHQPVILKLRHAENPLHLGWLKCRLPGPIPEFLTQEVWAEPKNLHS